jgi:hypothetical protein
VQNNTATTTLIRPPYERKSVGLWWGGVLTAHAGREQSLIGRDLSHDSLHVQLCADKGIATDMNAALKGTIDFADGNQAQEDEQREGKYLKEVQERVG